MNNDTYKTLNIRRDNKLDIKQMIPQYFVAFIYKWSDLTERFR